MPSTYFCKVAAQLTLLVILLSRLTAESFGHLDDVLCNIIKYWKMFCVVFAAENISANLRRSHKEENSTVTLIVFSNTESIPAIVDKWHSCWNLRPPIVELLFCLLFTNILSSYALFILFSAAWCCWNFTYVSLPNSCSWIVRRMVSTNPNFS